jgi:hypothetical protein
LCQRNRIERWENSCQHIPGAPIDEAIGKLLLESVTPLTLEVALQVQKELENRFNEADKLRKQQVEGQNTMPTSPESFYEGRS